LFQVRGMHAQFTLLSNSLCTMENSFHSLPNIPFTTFVGCSLLIQSSRSISDLKLASFADSTFNVRISLSSGDWMGRLHLDSSKHSVELCLEAREASVAVSQCTNGDSLMPVPPPFWQGKKGIPASLASFAGVAYQEQVSPICQCLVTAMCNLPGWELVQIGGHSMESCLETTVQVYSAPQPG